MKKSAFKKVRRSAVKIFKIKNRRGYAAICLDNLTEGSTPAQAVARLRYPLRRIGYELV